MSTDLVQVTNWGSNAGITIDPADTKGKRGHDLLRNAYWVVGVQYLIYTRKYINGLFPADEAVNVSLAVSIYTFIILDAFRMTIIKPKMKLFCLYKIDFGSKIHQVTTLIGLESSEGGPCHKRTIAMRQFLDF